MEKIKFKNRFRIKGPDGKTIRINTTLDVNGHLRYVEGFDNIDEAQEARDAYCYGAGANPDDYPVLPYSESVPHNVKSVSEGANKLIARKKIFSGKGLPFNTISRPKDERKYKVGQWYGKEVNFARSASYNKGISLVAKQGDNKRKERNRGSHDWETFDKVRRQPDQATFSLNGSVVDQIQKRNLKSFGEVKLYLKSIGFTNRQINNLIPQILESRK